MRLTLLLSAVVLASFARAAGADYFPLETGNEWVLQAGTSPPDVLHIKVHRSRTFEGQHYFLVSGWTPADVWLRKSSDGVVYSWDPATSTEQRLAHLAFGAPQYRTNISGCDQIAQPAEGQPPLPGPGAPALPVRYNPEGCRDAGFLQEMYSEGTGLTQRTVTTIAGPRSYELVFARVSGRILTGEDKTLVLRSIFAYGADGWLAGFSDYGLETTDLRMAADVRLAPEEVQSGATAFFLQGMNRSDDLFMYLKKEITATEGLDPNRAYRLAFDIEFASNAPTGCAGVGGAPGESVYLKAGASGDEPVSVLDASKHLTLNVDKGEQAGGGQDAGVVGSIENGTPCETQNPQYVRLRKTYSHPQVVRTDNRGVLWLLVGTDSGFEGLTGLYYTAITARLTPVLETNN